MDIHHMKPQSEGGLTTYPNLIALCPNCHRIAHKYKIPVKSLKRFKETWAEVCKVEADALPTLRSNVENVVAEARRLSLSDVRDDLIRARLLLEMVLARFDPLNIDAALLLHKVSTAVEKTERKPEHLHSIASIYAGWLGLFMWVWVCVVLRGFYHASIWSLLLVTPLGVYLNTVFAYLAGVITHELGHVAGLRAAFKSKFPGERTGYLKTWRHVHLNIAQLLSLGGFWGSFRGRFVGAYVDANGLWEDWLADISGRKELSEVWKAVATASTSQPFSL